MAELINYMETIVFNKLDVLLKNQEDICKCEQCRLDIAALALNVLPPRYVVTDKGKIYARIDTLETQFEIDVLLAIEKAIQLVRQNPRH